MNSLLKICMIAFVSVSSSKCCFAQTAPQDTKRYIEVTGSAETSVRPDEVVLLFTIQETRKKGTKDLIDLATAEASFFSILGNYGLKEKDITLYNNNTYGVDWYSVRMNRRVEYKYKKIALTVDSSISLVALMKDLEQEWISEISIVKLVSKHEQTLRKEIKIQALKAAKDKATYLLSAIGEEPGKVLFIEEKTEAPFTRDRTSNTLNLNEGFGDISNTNLIRIRYEMLVRFEIK